MLEDVNGSFSPIQNAIVEIGERDAIVLTVVVGGIELAVATAEELRFLAQEHVACGVTHPDCGVGVEVH